MTKVGITDHGITTRTPDNIMLGAGVIYRDFEWDDALGKWQGEILGATSGGNKLSIVPKMIDLELDGAVVSVERISDVKMGEEATIETSLVELTPDMVAKAVIGSMGDGEEEDFKHIRSKPGLEPGDFYDNLAFVGRKTDGSAIIVGGSIIMPIAIRTEATTMSITMNGRNMKNPMMNPWVNSPSIKAGMMIESGMSSGVSKTNPPARSANNATSLSLTWSRINRLIGAMPRAMASSIDISGRRPRTCMERISGQPEHPAER